MADGKVEYDVRANTDNLDADLEQANQQVEKGTGKLKGIASGTAKAVGASFLAVGTATFAVGGKAVSLANEVDEAMNHFAASTGVGVDGIEQYQDVMEQIYIKGYGESFEDIANSMALVKQQMGDISDEELQKVTESAFLFADTLDMDINESIRGANALMSQFGLDADGAFNLMAQGAQNGLNQNQDLADQLAEYSVYYADMGFTAEEMFNMVANGAEDGAFQIDYLNDAMKEFGIRSKDGSKASSEAFTALGLDADKMTVQFAKGGIDAKKAFGEVTKALSGVESDVDRNAIGVALFGTKFEDLGEDAVIALSDMTGEIDDTTDALGDMSKVKFNSIGEMFNELKRSAEMLLLPLGEMLIPVLTKIIQEILPILEEVLPPLIDNIAEFLPPLMQMVSDLLPVLVELFMALLPPVMELASAILPILIDVFEQLLPPIMEIIEMLLPPLIDLITTLMPVILDLATSLMPPLVEIFKALLPPILDLIDMLLPPLIDLIVALSPLIDALTPVIKMLAEMLGENLSNAIELLSPIIDNFLSYLEGIITFITGVFTGDWEMAWEGIKQIFSSIINQIPILVETAINGAIGAINKLINGVNKLTGTIGIDAIPNIPEVSLPRFHVGGIVDFNGATEGEAMLMAGEMVLTKAQQAQLFGMLNGIYPSGGSGVSSSNNTDVSINNNNTFYVRDDRDIELISTELSNQQQRDIAAIGGK